MSSQSSASTPGRFVHALRLAVDIILGVIAGVVLAVIVTNVLLYAQGKGVYTTVNGWSTTVKAGRPGNSVLLRALMADFFPAANVAEEAAYWTTTKDSTGQKLDGEHAYVLHFPSGGLPPNDAFWSLTMTNARKVLVSNAINRYSVGDRSGLVTNADGSTDIYIQNSAPTGHDANWLPAPAGAFMLWLRAYQPGPSVLDGTYHVPPVVEVK